MQGKLALASSASPVRKPSDCSASINWRTECGAGKFCSNNAASNGSRLTWHRLPISQTKSGRDNFSASTFLPVLALGFARVPVETLADYGQKPYRVKTLGPANVVR